jgi:hypothetical protein
VKEMAEVVLVCIAFIPPSTEREVTVHPHFITGVVTRSVLGSSCTGEACRRVVDRYRVWSEREKCMRGGACARIKGCVVSWDHCWRGDLEVAAASGSVVAREMAGGRLTLGTRSAASQCYWMAEPARGARRAAEASLSLRRAAKSGASGRNVVVSKRRA